MSEMKRYIGTKLVQAEPMTRGAYNEYRGWTIPADENPNDEGWLIRYQDGYESWSPKDVFEEAYRPTDGMSFGLAIEAVKKGERAARRGWNGKGMYIFLAEIDELRTDADLSDVAGECFMHECIVMRNAQAELCPGWLASQADMLADDWYILEDAADE